VSPSFSRRDFLKLSATLPLSLALPPRLASNRWLQPAATLRNVLVIVLDAFSAYHISHHGYSRQTTPNLDRLAGRAIVYHNHHAGGNFTTSGTASLLTGVYPWTHRALQFRGRTARRFYTRNLFSVFEDYYRFAYTHNGWAQIVLRPMAGEMQELLAVEDLLLRTSPKSVRYLFRRDDDIAKVAWGRAMGAGFDGVAYSLYLSAALAARPEERAIAQISANFPRGLPGDGEVNAFIMETAVDWLADEVQRLPTPFLGYVHLLPPHAPYRTRRDFVDRFAGDGFAAPQKPRDLFAGKRIRDEELERRLYDEFILYADAEFDRLFRALEQSGVLNNTWLILTSDHGEMFERGLIAHATDTLYQPEIRIPLMIFEPGRTVGAEIRTLTSAVDILPTLSHITGHAIPSWVEGLVLPPFAHINVDPDRSVFAFMATDNDPARRVKKGTAAVIRGANKLQYYFGYPALGGRELVKMFNIESDPQELFDVAELRAGDAAGLLAETKAALDAAEEGRRS
jgi:choline-sulfatase